jgi:hypothetical protein
MSCSGPCTSTGMSCDMYPIQAWLDNGYSEYRLNSAQGASPYFYSTMILRSGDKSNVYCILSPLESILNTYKNSYN